VRDVGQLKDMQIGVKALGTCPRKSNKRSTGERNVVLEMFGVVIVPNQLVIADEDGVVLLPLKAKL
jgi:regulator of ribonuclease activity A